MAIDKIVVEVVGDAKGVKPVVDGLEEVNKVSKKNADQFRKANDEFVRAAAERKKRIDEETQDLAELQIAKKKAFSVEDIKQYNDRIRETKDRINTLKGETGKMAGFLKGQFAMLGGAIAGAFAVTQLVSFGKEAVNLAAKGEGIRRAFTALNQADLLDNLRAATRNTVSDIDLMAAAVKANNFRIPLEDLARYFQFAQQRARETGESVDYLVESIVLGIGRKSPLILDNLGISAVELRAKLKGIGTESASVAQISAAVGQIIDGELKKQGELLDTTADKLARLEAAWKNFGESAGIALVDFYDIASKLSTGAGVGMGGLGDAIEAERNKIEANIAKGLNNTIAAIKERTEAWKEEERQNKKTVFSLSFLEERLKTLKDELKDLEIGSKEYDITMKNMVLIQNLLDKALGKTTTAIKEQKKELESDVPTEMLEQMAEGQRQAAQKRIDEEQKTIDAIKNNEEDLMEHINKLHEEQDKKDKDASEERIRQADREAQAKLDIEEIYKNLANDLALKLADGAFQTMAAYSQKDAEIFLQNLEEKRRAGEITEEEYTAARKQFLITQAKDEKALAIYQATVKAALAVINAITTGDPYTAAARAAVAGAIGAAEIAIIAAQPLPTFEKGGKVKGKSHREGGVKAELEGDEFIINKRAAKKIGFDNLEMLNKGIVPVKLLKQGISDSRDKKMENTLKAVFGSNDFDTYPIEKILKKGMKQERDLTHLLIKKLSGTKQKRGY